MKRRYLLTIVIVELVAVSMIAVPLAARAQPLQYVQQLLNVPAIVRLDHEPRRCRVVRTRMMAEIEVAILDAAGDYEWRAATSSDGPVRPGTVSAAPDTGEPTTIMEESSA